MVGQVGRAFFFRKVVNYEDLLDRESATLIHNPPTSREVFTITDEVVLEKMDFEKFKKNILLDYKWIQDKDPRAVIYVRPKYKKAEGLVVLPEGYSYPRYIGIPYEL